MSGTVNCTFDLTKDGKQAGYLKVGDSTNNSGWTTYNVPIISIKNGDGPSALVLGGNHGDEYEGQIAASTLSRNLQPDQIKGQVIIIPCLSQEASRGGTRHWPDGVNFNRIFPGNEDGPVSSKLAYYLTHELFPKVDAVMDIHSGGRGHVFIPCSHTVWAKDEKQRAKMLKSMLAWNSSYSMIFPEQPSTNPASLLPGEAERQGKEVFTTELGGGALANHTSVKVAKDGLDNALRTLGILNGAPKTREEQGLPSAIILDMRAETAYHSVNDFGLYENLFPLGGSIKKGEVLGLVHNMDNPEVPAVPVIARQDGVLGVERGYPRVTPGDVVALVGMAYKSVADLPAL